MHFGCSRATSSRAAPSSRVSGMRPSSATTGCCGSETMSDHNQRTGQRWVLALTSAASFMVSLDSQVVAAALTTIRLDLGASIEGLEWSVNAYVLSFAVLLLTGAGLGDRFGRRRMMIVGLGLFAAASVACALAEGVGGLIAARAAQGAAGAVVMPLSMALLSTAFGRQ